MKKINVHIRLHMYTCIYMYACMHNIERNSCLFCGKFLIYVASTRHAPRIVLQSGLPFRLCDAVHQSGTRDPVNLEAGSHNGPILRDGARFTAPSPLEYIRCSLLCSAGLINHTATSHSA